VLKSYDPADDGQARIYSSLFAQTIATIKGERAIFANFKAWKDARGEIFPDFKAAIRGERPLFANLRATISQLIASLKQWLSQFNQNRAGQGMFQQRENKPAIDQPDADEGALLGEKGLPLT
jgi:hypothetical protein